ncbi:MAG: HIT family protein [Wenzhouxiangellaceae bacterium]
MNATLHRFGYPDTLLLEGSHWAVLLRPAQVTLGSLILGCRDQSLEFSELPEQAIVEFGTMVRRIEQVLSGQFGYEKINYLMLMMVDPHVHFHVIPRYSKVQRFASVAFEDTGWPGPPDLAHRAPLDQHGFARLRDRLRAAFNGS